MQTKKATETYTHTHTQTHLIYHSKVILISGFEHDHLNYRFFCCCRFCCVNAINYYYYVTMAIILLSSFGVLGVFGVRTQRTLQVD